MKLVHLAMIESEGTVQKDTGASLKELSLPYKLNTKRNNFCQVPSDSCL
jgi:hypothetical protein